MSESSGQIRGADDRERQRRQRKRSLAIGIGLGCLVILFYAATIVRLGPNALRKTGQPASTTTKISADDNLAACKKAGTCP